MAFTTFSKDGGFWYSLVADKSLVPSRAARLRITEGKLVMPGFHSRLGLLLLSALVLFVSFLPAAGPSYAATVAQSKPLPPEITARAAIVVEYPSGRILYQKDARTRVAPASTTKLLTAIMALEYGNLDEEVVVAPTDLVRGSKMGLRSGERQTMRNLLYGLMLPSGNDAAMTIARHLGEQAGSSAAGNDPVSRFSSMMNARAAELGLRDTHFVNPHGLDKKDHYSSAYDLASLTWYAMHYPLFNQIVRQPNYDAPGHPLKNLNKLIGEYPGADGVKTGYTRRAGLCLVSSATRNGKRVIAVVLNAPEWVEDSTALLDYGFASLAVQPKQPGAPKLNIAKRPTSTTYVAGWD